MLRRQEKVYSKKKEEEVEFTVVPLAKVIILQNKKIESLGTLPITPDRMGFHLLVLSLLLVQYKYHKQGKKSSLNN